jgi:multiple sugar transport system substrate-binding protein
MKILQKLAIKNIVMVSILMLGQFAVGQFAVAGNIVINYDGTDKAVKKAFTMIVSEFEKAHPDIKVKVNTFDHEGYKTSIRNFLTAKAPDVAAWYAGNRMAPFVNAGLFEDVTDVWESAGYNDSLASSAMSLTMKGKKWGVPYSTYQWGVYYRKDIFDKLGIKTPKNWKQFLAACKTLKKNKIIPITIGTKYLWTAAGVFDYLNLRVNGYDFHNDLTAGKVKYTDPKMQVVFDRWDELVKPGYFIKNHAALSWQDAIAPMVQGKAAMYVMGNFLVSELRSAGLKDDQIGFFEFPEITPGIPKAVEAPTETFHIPSKAKNKKDARVFLAFLAQPKVQTAWSKITSQLPVNKYAKIPNDKFLQAGFKILNEAHGISQFYDRDAPAAMAKAGMEGFQNYMVHPERRAKILKKLDKVQKKVYRLNSKK